MSFQNLLNLITMKQLFFTITFLLCFYAAEAQKNEQAYYQVIKTLKISEEDIDEELYTEKVLPYDTNKLVMVFPLAKGDENEASFDLYVVVYNLLQKKIAQFYKGIDEYSSDAIVLEKLSIDTAKFIVNEKERAFGLRAYFRNYSRVSAFSEETFSLFLPQETSLKKILNQYSLNTSRSESYDECEASLSENSTSMFMMDSKKTKGYFNIKNRITLIRNTFSADCRDEKEEKSTKIVFLKYNGKEYKEE